jgi:hypothetical protein
VIGPSGGLCGLASLYQALENTIYTVSQLTQLTYAGMRATIAEEMGINSTATTTLSDSDLLDQFYACKLDSNKKCIYKPKKLPKPKQLLKTKMSHFLERKKLTMVTTLLI